jgi:type I restriction enzyme M protein
MTYWHSSMHDDVFLIMNEGWVAASKPRTAIEDKERKLSETPDLILGAGKNATKLKMDLIPLELIVSRYFAVDRVHLDGLTAQAEAALRAVEEYVEEHGDDDGLLFDAVNDKGKVSQSSVKDLLKEAKSADDTETVDCAKVALDLLQAEAAAKKAAKDALEVLNSAAFKKYGELDEPEVQAIVLQDKWAKSLSDRVAEEINALTLRLVARIQDLGDRYAETLDDIEVDLSQLEAKVSMHLEDMGVR